MSERPADLPPAEPPTPRTSACAVLVRREPGEDGRLRVLLGRRSRRSRFMPGHLAFPGGGLEAVDGAPDDDASWARCATRELREETGLDVDPRRWLPAGRRVTPPIFPVRFDTRFFVAEADPAARPDASVSGGEIEALGFEAPGATVQAWEAGREALPPPVLPLLRTLDGLADDAAPDAVAAALADANAQEERAPRIEFAPDVWMLPLPTATMPPASHTNCWLPGRERFVIVDPAAADATARTRLLEVVARRRALGGEPLAVLLTHGHRDHRDGAAEVARELRLPLRAHPALLGGGDFEPLDDGERLELGRDLSLVAVHTPGHAPGHLVFHLPERRLLIAGDLVGGLSTILIPPGHGEMKAYLASLRRAIALDCRTLLPGHGPPLPAKALQRTLRHRAMRAGRILEALADGPLGLAELADAAYAETPGLPPALIRAQSAAHLEALAEDGLVRRLDGERWATAGDVGARLRTLLEARFAPLVLEIVDDSASHRGHPGAASGGGHFVVTIVSAEFEGRSRLEQHRLVNGALRGLLGREIHALALRTAAPSERAGGA